MNATSLPLTHSRTNLAVPIAALLAGAAISAGAFTLADTDESSATANSPSAAAPQADDSRAPGVRGLASSLANR